MEVLLTGYRGFIGEVVYKFLFERDINTTVFLGDVTNTDTFPRKKFSHILHLAALITHKGRVSDERLNQVNYIGTKNFLKFYNDSKMIFISTVDVMRTNLSSYAKTKLKAESIVSEKENSLIIRLPSVFGPKQRQIKLIPLLFRKYCKDENVKINNNDIREYAYVDDVADYIINNLNEEGLRIFEGYKINNHELDKSISQVCSLKKISDIKNFKKKHFIECLKKCLSYYRE